MKEAYHYPGAELALFEKAIHWKQYFAKQLRPYLGRQVLEVGSGIGGTTALLHDGMKQWTLLEPDPEMAEILAGKIANDPLFANCSLLQTPLQESLPTEHFDTILYIDVLEHIENDRAELECAARCLKPNGHLIVLAPAFAALMSPFDKAIGHYRRYNRKSLRSAAPYELSAIRFFYLDSMGFFASLLNKYILKQSYPSEKQVLFWDRCIIRLSKQTDPIFFHSFGKTVIGIWRKN